MGVSADRSSALSTAVQLFSLLSLPISPEELDRDMTRLNRYSHELVPKLFERYDRTKAPYPENGGPVEIVSYLMVDHIEELNQFQQTLTFHGTLILNWLDARLAWEPQDFGSLDRLSFTGFDLGRFWSPGVTVKGVTMPVRNLAMFHNTAYTLMSTGHIFAEMSVSLKAACRLDLANYPNDNQTCFVMVFTPLYSTAKVTFTASSSLMGRHSMFSESGQTTMASGFELDDLNAQRFFAYAKGFTTNQSEADLYSSLTNTVLRYQICLRRRDNGMYTAAVALPLFCLSVMAFAAFFVPSVRLSLLWLLACILLLLMHNQRMAQFLPQDFDSEPLCVRLARLLLLQLVALLVIRLWFAFQQKTSVNGSTSSKLPAADGAAILPQFLVDGGGYQSPSQIWTRRLHGILRWALMAETVMLFFWLFL